MSKRVQITLSGSEYLALTEAAQRQGKPVPLFVRENLRRMLAEVRDEQPEKRIAAVLEYARFAGPTGDIEQVLDDIERGRGLE